MEKIQELKLHESINIKPNCWAMRVPGGLIYQFKNSNGWTSTNAFVPFNDFNID